MALQPSRRCLARRAVDSPAPVNALIWKRRGQPTHRKKTTSSLLAGPRFGWRGTWRGDGGWCGCLVLHGEASEAKSQVGLLDLRGTNQRCGGIGVWALGNLEGHTFPLVPSFSIFLLFTAALVSLEPPGPGGILPLQAVELYDPLQHRQSPWEPPFQHLGGGAARGIRKNPYKVSAA